MPALADSKHETFARTRATGHSKAQAAIAAGYAESDAASRGSKLARKPEIAERIRELEQQAADLAIERAQITKERVLEELAKLAFCDIRKLFREDGTLIPVTELDPETAGAIAGLEVESKRQEAIGTTPEESAVLVPMTARLHKIKLGDKKGALDSLAKYLGMFAHRVEVTGKNGGPIEIGDARKLLADRIARVAARVRADETDREPDSRAG